MIKTKNLCLVSGFFALMGAGILWQKQELNKFGVTHYEFPVSGLKQEKKIVVLADLHGFSYGKKNERLITAIQEAVPDFILIAGDMIVSKYPESYDSALHTLSRLVKIAPVYYSMGNHETRADRRGASVYPDFQKYCRRAKRLGVIFLRNDNIRLPGKEELWIGGLEIGLDYYERGRNISMKWDYIKERMGKRSVNGYQILLAHNPAYSKQYAAWGADITLCGHNHGGLVRIPGVGSLISPQFTFFPKYSEGLHMIYGRKVIISRGLGTHTFHIRVFNRAELIEIRLFPNYLENPDVNG